MCEARFRLLQEWLGCNDEAGKKFWFEEGIFFQYVAAGKGKLRRLGWENYREYSMEQIEGEITSWLYETIILGRLKPPEGAPKSFENMRLFHGYMRKSLEGIRDFIPQALGIPLGQEIRFVPLDPRSGAKKKKEEEEEEKIPYGEQDWNKNPEDLFLSEESRGEIEAAFSMLLKRFGIYLGKKRPKLKEHLDLLREAFESRRNDAFAGEEERRKMLFYAIVLFLEETGRPRYPEISAYCIARGVNTNTYFANNRRLRLVWRSFVAGEGAEDWERLKRWMRGG